MLEPNKAEARAKAQYQEDDITLKSFRALAEETGAWILAGSLVIKKPDDDRLANRSFLIRPDGGIAAQYDKIHMFDVELSNGESHKESRAYAPGNKRNSRKQHGERSAFQSVMMCGLPISTSNWH